jgi:dephospho-CoA kinase
MVRPVLRVGLTGGVGSGKSSAARLLAAHGAVIVDADVLARDVVAPGTEGLAEVVRRFGPGVLAPGGELDRGALGRIVFADPAARADLERIVHPRVRAAAQVLEDVAVRCAPDAVVVHDIPLLVETGQAGPGSRFRPVVVVDASDEVRLARLVGRGMSDPEARARMTAQASRGERLAAADVVLDNEGPPGALAAQVEALWRRLRAAARSGSWPG